MFSLLFSIALFEKREELSFLSYMREHNTYFTGEEYAARLAIFVSNCRFIEEHNKGSYSYRLGVNGMAHLTSAEYRAKSGLRLRAGINRPTTAEKPNVEIPDSLDWREKGIVPPIKDQGMCGSCWAFSAVAAMEGAYGVKYGEMISLSEQNFVDCAWFMEQSGGCEGADPTEALNWVKYYQDASFMKDSDYPYNAVQGNCAFDASKVACKIDQIITVSCNENDLKNKCAQYGTISACIDDSLSSFQYYADGIYSDRWCSQNELTHAIAVVGYGTEDGTDYWLIRNSWGTDWGIKGYMKLLRGSNMCGISMFAIGATSQ